MFVLMNQEEAYLVSKSFLSSQSLIRAYGGAVPHIWKITIVSFTWSAVRRNLLKLQNIQFFLWQCKLYYTYLCVHVHGISLSVINLFQSYVEMKVWVFQNLIMDFSGRCSCSRSLLEWQNNLWGYQIHVPCGGPWSRVYRRISNSWYENQNSVSETFQILSCCYKFSIFWCYKERRT